MTSDEFVPLDANYFELGLTSLRVTEIKQRLEQQLGCELNASVLFNSPTVAGLLEHLTQEALPELFGRETGADADDAREPRGTFGHKPIVDRLLNRLYEA